jgi:hypothetical protein
MVRHIGAGEGPQPKRFVRLHLMLTAGRVALRVVSESGGRHADLLCDVVEHCRRRRLPGGQCPAGVAQVAELRGEPDPVGMPSPRHDQGNVIWAERVVADERLAVARRIEQRGALLR